MSEETPSEDTAPTPNRKLVSRTWEQATGPRRILWVLGLGAGLYMLGQGIIGIITGGS